MGFFNIGEMNMNNDILWSKKKDDIVTIGIKKKVLKELGEIVFITLPTVGLRVKKDMEVMVVESNKAAYDIYSPVEGVIIEVNEELKSCLDKLNTSSETTGWLFKIKAV
jgi:glycine cleavage system H protein